MSFSRANLFRKLAAARSFWLFLLAALIILSVSFLFTLQVLKLDSELVIQNAEFEPNAGLISVAYSSLRDHGEFPLWNPYADTGVPYLGDPVSYLFNPLGSVPGLILGPINGPKIGILLAVLFSGLSGYYLASALGLSWPARIWAGVFLAINGHLTARFFGGQFQLGIAFPFIAFSFAFFIQSLRREGAWYPILAGASVALLLFSGLLYYFLFVIPGLVITFLFFAAASQSEGLRTDRLAHLVKRSATAAAWALGFSAVLIIPFYQTFDFVGKDADRFLRFSQTMPDSFLNFLVSDREYYREPNRGMPGGFLQEFYSYVGIVPALALLFVIPAFRRGNRLLIGLMATLFLFYLAWSSARHTPFSYVYDTFPFLFNFRWSSRALAPATPMLIMLGAIGIDYLYQLLSSIPKIPRRQWFGSMTAPPIPIGVVLSLVLLALLAYNARDVFSTNRELYGLVQRRQDHLAVAEWFAENETSPAYVWMFDSSPGISLRLVEQGILRLDPAYWQPKLQYPPLEGGDQGAQVIEPRAEYIVLTNDATPQQEDARLVGVLPNRYIYRLEDSPSFASLVDSRAPPLGVLPWGDRAREATARIVSPNVIEVEATSSGVGDDTVLVLQSYFSGWRVEVDGERIGAADNLGGFISTEAQPGAHVYRFVFDPAAQRYGLAISAGTVLGALLIVSPIPRLVGRLRRRPEK